MISRCPKCGDWCMDAICHTCIVLAARIHARVEHNVAVMAEIRKVAA